jgi:uncharacterized protein
VKDNLKQLRLNVGFLINQSVGTSRDFEIYIPYIHFDPDFELHDLTGLARVTRTPQGLLVQVKLSALTPAECVRCLTDFPLPLQANFTELYAFANKAGGDSEVLPENAQIDLAPLAREYLMIEFPINPVCRPQCKGLCSICGEPLNEKHQEHLDDSTDPRLAVLKSLLDDQE